jgi:hypothetical protein
VIAILLGIEGINALVVLGINFLYIFVTVGRKLRFNFKIKDAFGEKWPGGWCGRVGGGLRYSIGKTSALTILYCQISARLQL